MSAQSATEIKEEMTTNLPQRPDQTPQFSMQDVENASIEYFNGDSLAGTVFSTKYALRNNNIISLKNGDEPKQFVELTPDAMHDRLAYEFAKKDEKYKNPVSFDTFRKALNRFQYIVPQGSPMYGVGNPFVKVSISNCVVVDYPKDNMSGIMESGKDLANLFKRRCVEENTLIWTLENGLVPIKDVQIGMHVYSFNPETKNDVWRKITDKFKSDVEPEDRIKLKTAEGTVLRTSKKHPVLVFDHRGYGYVPTGEIEIGDTLVKPSDNIEFSKTSALMDANIAWWIGAHIGNGDANFNNGIMRFRISGDNKAVIDGYAEVLHRMNEHNCKVQPSTRKDYKTDCWQFANRMSANARIAELFLETNIGKKCYTAKVPSYIVKNELWWPFIAGLIDTDGWAKNGSTLTFGVCAKEIANSVGAFLSSRGIRYHVAPYESGRDNEQPVYRVTIHQDVTAYAEILPYLRHDKKKKSISDAKLRPFSRVAYPISASEKNDIIDKYKQVEKHPPGNLATIMCNIKKTGDKLGIGSLKELLTNGVVTLDAYNEIQRRSTIISIESDVDATEYWDIQVEGTNNFYAGNYGLVNIHNCGVGLSLDTLRPDGTAVSNSAGTSTGAWSFANYFSEVCRMIGQNGRRGALMITMNVLHPDIPQFTVMKRDKSRVTGANVSIMLTDEFMLAVENDEDWICRWPLDVNVDSVLEKGGEWQQYDAAEHLNRPIACKKWIPNTPSKNDVLVSYRATELWHLINESAVTCAEPGLLFWDNYGNNLPAHSYEEFKLVCVNPCVTDDTWIMTDKGAVQVKNLIGTPFNAIVDGKSYSSTERGFYETGTKHVFEVKTNRGYSLKATANHPVLVETKNKRAKAVRTWKNVGDLEIGDKIVLNRHKNVQWDGAGTKDEGWLLGNLLGDGNMQKNGISNLDFWGEKRKDMLSVAIATILESVGGRSDMTGQNQEEYNRSRVSSSKLNLLANKFGMTHGNKKLNELIENSSSDFHSGFLKGWFDTDGSVQGNLEKGLSVRLTSVSLDGLLGAQRMLARLGILSTVYMNRHSEGYQMMPDGHDGNKEYYCQARHELTIANENIQTFVERVGFVDSDKMDKLSAIIKQYKRSVNKDSGYSVVCEVNPIGVETVYDCTVPEISAFDANGLMVHNCAEIGLSPYDSCRLTSLNLKGYVLNPYTPEARFDYETFNTMTRLGMRIMDDIVDIEIDCLTKIIDSCDEPEEKVLWNKLRNAAERGRRTGLGMHGLADALACLNLRYDSDAALAEVDKISEAFCVSAYDASVDLAIERGVFPAFDWNTEKDCAFIKRLPDWLQEKMSKHGRRNISLLTIAPTGSVSIVSQTSSGLEPVFSNFYTRRRKINPSDVGTRVDFTDQNGDKWQEYPVFHNNVQQYLVATNKMEEWKRIEETTPAKSWAEEFQKILPEWFVTAPEIDAKRRVEIQGHIQRWIDHGISSCLAEGTASVQTDKGLFEIEELTSGAKDGEFIDITTNIKSVNEHSCLATVTQGYNNGVRPVKRLTMVNGHSITCTENHRLLTLDGSYKQTWKYVSDLAIGDIVIGRIGLRLFNNQASKLTLNQLVGTPFEYEKNNASKKIRIPTHMSIELARLLGYMCSDASVGQNGISLCQLNNNVVDDFANLVDLLFGVKVSLFEDKRSDNLYNVIANSRELSAFFKWLGVGNHDTIEVPKAIRLSHMSAVKAFIRGVTLDGHVSSERVCVATSVSHKYLRQIQAMLVNLGIESSLLVSGESGKREFPHGNICVTQKSWSLTLSQSSAKQFANQIGFAEDRKNEEMQSKFIDSGQEKVNEYIPDFGIRLNFRNKYLPKIKSKRLHGIMSSLTNTDKQGRAFSRESLQEMADFGYDIPEFILDKTYSFRPIVKIEDCGIMNTHDISVPDGNSYIANGVVSHNTINMPKGTTIEQGQELYMLAWQHGLKGVTIYVDGSRSGVLVNFGESKDPTTEIVESKCPKRPKELPCDIHHIKVDGTDWVAFVGLLNGVPYEVFGGAKEQVDIPKKIKKGKIAKRKCDKVNAKGRTACYDLIIGEDDDEWKIKDVAVSFENGNYAAQTRMISLSLRHGVPAQFVAEQLSRDLESDFHSFSRVMARVLKQYVVDGATGSEKCEICKEKLIFENGCMMCKNCGDSKCN